MWICILNPHFFIYFVHKYRKNEAFSMKFCACCLHFL
nr:MAG TPA_asm: hypothetical protein [Caudoviricetes sp.]